MTSSSRFVALVPRRGAGSLLVLTLLSSASAPAQSLVWAEEKSGVGNVRDVDVGWDGLGHFDTIATTGTFAGSITLGAGTPNETTLFSESGSVDMFVARYDPDGNFRWARAAGGSGLDEGLGVAITRDGEATVTGKFHGTATFGAGQLNETVLVSAGNADIFIARYDRDGNLRWARRAGGASPAFIDSGAAVVAVPHPADVVIAGTFGGAATFGLGETNETTLTSQGASHDGFVARYAIDGTLVWARRLGGVGDDAVSTVALAPDNSLRIGGHFQVPADFGGLEIIQGDGSVDAFVARLELHGAVIWVQGIEGPNSQMSRDVSVAPDGSTTVSGFFTSTAGVGVGTPQEIILASAGDADVFVAQYDSSGQPAWARSIGGSGFDAGHGTAHVSDGSVIVAGSFQDSMTLGVGPKETALTSAGREDIFLASFSVDGGFNWARRVGGGGSDIPVDLVVPIEPFRRRLGDLMTLAGTANAVFGAGEVTETSISGPFVSRYSSSLLSPGLHLEASDGVDGDAFGRSMAIDGDVVVIGAPSANNLEGAAYVHRRTGGTWIEEARLEHRFRRQFGDSVAASSGTIVVGAPLDGPGAAFVFRQVNGVWQEVAELAPLDPKQFQGFGSSVDVRDDLIVVAARGDDATGDRSGAVYLFRLVDGTWAFDCKLVPTDGTAHADFGSDVFIAGDRVAIGAPAESLNSVNSGAVYVFEHVSGAWIQTKVAPTDAQPRHFFGGSVALAGDTLVASAIGDDDGAPNAGAAYVFRQSGGSWTQVQKLVPSDVVQDTNVGVSASISGNLVVIGAHGDDDLGWRSGAAYVYGFDGAAWAETTKLRNTRGLSGRSIRASDHRRRSRSRRVRPVEQIRHGSEPRKGLRDGPRARPRHLG